MGLFGGIFKAVGKVVGGVAKGVASKLTGGVSDSVLKLLKGRGAAKQVAASPDVSMQQQALLAKAFGGAPLTPKVVRQHLEPVSRLYGVGTGGGGGSSKRMPGRRKMALRESDVDDMHDAAEYRRQQKRARMPAKPRTKKKRAGGASRTVPRGGLDLKAISAMWKAEGKPGSWPQYVKAHSDVRMK